MTELEQYEAWKQSGFTMKEFDKAESLWKIGPGALVGLGLIAIVAFCQLYLGIVK